MFLTYDGFCCAAGLRKTSTNSEIVAVQELMPLQIGRSGGKNRNLCRFWAVHKNKGCEIHLSFVLLQIHQLFGQIVRLSIVSSVACLYKGFGSEESSS